MLLHTREKKFKKKKRKKRRNSPYTHYIDETNWLGCLALVSMRFGIVDWLAGWFRRGCCLSPLLPSLLTSCTHFIGQTTTVWQLTKISFAWAALFYVVSCGFRSTFSNVARFSMFVVAAAFIVVKTLERFSYALLCLPYIMLSARGRSTITHMHF